MAGEWYMVHGGTVHGSVYNQQTTEPSFMQGHPLCMQDTHGIRNLMWPDPTQFEPGLTFPSATERVSDLCEFGTIYTMSISTMWSRLNQRGHMLQCR